VIEYFPDVEPDTGNELFWKLFDGNLEQQGGMLTFDLSRPGLGIAPNEEVARELLVDDGPWLRDGG
jgi:hypothetical protein